MAQVRGATSWQPTAQRLRRPRVQHYKPSALVLYRQGSVPGRPAVPAHTRVLTPLNVHCLFVSLSVCVRLCVCLSLCLSLPVSLSLSLSVSMCCICIDRSRYESSDTACLASDLQPCGTDGCGNLTTAAQCKALCHATPGCAGFTWQASRLATVAHSNGRRCWLKRGPFNVQAEASLSCHSPYTH